jgi:multiple sugar transport system ATP-binding protein|tara:strand:- start:5111 stop:6214 length:1104 start_codon:yes stop_codon:yes gene_type:complete
LNKELKMAAIEIRDVKKSYGSAQVLHGVSIDIADGEFVILVGPSGCGKSTLLRMVAGLESITGGEVAIDDKVVNDLPPKQRDIAMVFQSYALYPHMDVAENMAFSLKLAKRPKAEIEQKVNAAAEILGLKPLLKRRPAHLSGGQRQRVAMGRAIVRDPKVFLFDEPLSNLDAQLRVQMRTEIKDLHRRLKTTIVYVTHDQIEAMTMADRIVVMNQGRVEQYGTPLELFDRPANLFVARFIGSPSMNLVDCTLDAASAAPTLRTAGGMRVAIPKERADTLGTTDLVLGVRPENLKVVQADDPTAFAAEVMAVEPTGSEVMLSVAAGEDHLLLLLRERSSLQVGDTVHLSVDPDHVHVFDRQTSQRVDF